MVLSKLFPLSSIGVYRLIKNQTRLTCKVKFDDNSIDLIKAEDDNNKRAC